MFRPSRKSTPLRSKQQEIAREEAQLREKLEKLERLVAKGDTSRHGEKRDASGNRPEKRLLVSIALDGAQSPEISRSSRRPRSLRKQRREGQFIFLFLLAALAVAVMWLITHLHP